jgi:selenocysteine-specific elongation factor
MQVVIGTAGHIDHGKTSLVEALTGTNTDNLDEEKSRGMTINLGFAYLNENITIIDVPGHEKFVRNMVAGVSTIDVALLVIAADDGIMPQTREHLQILLHLGIPKCVVALTKVDRVQDAEWIELVTLDSTIAGRVTFL